MSLRSSDALGAAVFMAALLTIMSAPWAMNLPALAWVFKPLTTVLIIGYAWGRGRNMPAARRWVLIGLVCSLVGDVALLWPDTGFLPGLVSFLLAHLAYLIAFTRVRRFFGWWLPFVVYALVAGGVLFLLWRTLPSALRWPVLVYVVFLASMAAQAAAVWRASRGTEHAGRAAALAVGGALFVLSDALLAINRFGMPLPLSGLWILGSYWAAQWCIASWLAPTVRRRVHMPLKRPV